MKEKDKKDDIEKMVEEVLEDVGVNPKEKKCFWRGDLNNLASTLRVMLIEGSNNDWNPNVILGMSNSYTNIALCAISMKLSMKFPKVSEALLNELPKFMKNFVTNNSEDFFKYKNFHSLEKEINMDKVNKYPMCDICGEKTNEEDGAVWVLVPEIRKAEEVAQNKKYIEDGLIDMNTYKPDPEINYYWGHWKCQPNNFQNSYPAKGNVTTPEEIIKFGNHLFGKRWFHLSRYPQLAGRFLSSFYEYNQSTIDEYDDSEL